MLCTASALPDVTAMFVPPLRKYKLWSLLETKNPFAYPVTVDGATSVNPATLIAVIACAPQITSASIASADAGTAAPPPGCAWDCWVMIERLWLTSVPHVSVLDPTCGV